MWEAISKIATGENSIVAFGFCLIIFFAFIVLVKTGVISLTTKNLRIGADEKERTIIRSQIEWVKLYCDGLESRIPHPEGYNKYRGLYVLERLYDEIITWITFNHITTNDSYIEIKQNKVINLVNALTEKPEFQSEEFRNMIKDEMKFVIYKLLQIRELYKKGDKVE